MSGSFKRKTLKNQAFFYAPYYMESFHSPLSLPRIYVYEQYFLIDDALLFNIRFAIKYKLFWNDGFLLCT